MAYIQQEFSAYSSCMSKKFQTYNDMYHDFSDVEKSQQITKRLTKADLDCVEIIFSHNNKEESEQIENLSSMNLYTRFHYFWDMIAELKRHKKGGCDITISEIIFHF
jgi:hypothetical protein